MHPSISDQFEIYHTTCTTPSTHFFPPILPSQNMSSPHALRMPHEIWLKIAGHLRPDLIYCVRACCSPPIPSPGADIVGPLFTPAFTRDIFNLSCACRILRSILEDDIRSVLSLYMRRRHRDNILVHQPRSGWPSCNTSNDEENYSESAAEVHEIGALPLGSHVRHLRLALREFNYYSFEAVTTLSQEYCDNAVPIIRGVPFLQSLKISARFNQSDHAFNLSPAFCQALATLQHLHTLKILGLTIPADCPILRWVEHMQTDTQIHSFESFPRLKDLRYVPEAPLLSYSIPSNVLARLEILHYYPPDKDDDCALLPQICRVSIFID
jgi:hypothetical protein